jgi:bacterioferritin
MQGKQTVIDALNTLLVYELAARDQYFIHSRMLDEWGFGKVATRIAHEMEDETSHADALIRRILMLDGTPDMKPAPLNVGADLPGIFTNDLAVELLVVKHLREVISLTEKEQDYVSRDLLLPMLKDTEEDHAHWLEQQLRLIKLMGEQNYLQSAAS